MKVSLVTKTIHFVVVPQRVVTMESLMPIMSIYGRSFEDTLVFLTQSREVIINIVAERKSSTEIGSAIKKLFLVVPQ